MLSERVLSRKNIVGKISPRIATKPVFECQNLKKIIVCKPIQYELKYVIIMQSFIVLSFFLDAQAAYLAPILIGKVGWPIGDTFRFPFCLCLFVH